MGFWGWVGIIIVALIVLANLEAVLSFIGVILAIAAIIAVIGGIGYGIYKGGKAGIEADKRRRAETLRTRREAEAVELDRKERERYEKAVSEGVESLIRYIEPAEADSESSAWYVPLEAPYKEDAKNEIRALFATRIRALQTLEELDAIKMQAPLGLVPKIDVDLKEQRLAIQEALDRKFAQSKDDIAALSLYVKKWESNSSLFSRKLASRLDELRREEAVAEQRRKAQLAAEAQQREIEKRATELLQEIENQADWLDSNDDETVKRARFFIREKLATFESDPGLLNASTKQSENFRTRVFETFETLKSNESYSGNLVSRFQRTFGEILIEP